MITIIKSLSIFILAGLCEIGGGYLVWLTLRAGKPWWVGVLGYFGGLWNSCYLAAC